METTEEIAIIPLGEDEPSGYFSYGHHKPSAFTAAVTVFQEQNEEVVRVGPVEHVWWLQEAWPNPDIDPELSDYSVLKKVDGPGGNAFAATVAYISGDWE